MKKIMLTGVDGNLGGTAAEILLGLKDKDELLFAGYDLDSLKKYEELGVETRVINLNDPESLESKFDDIERVGLISKPFVSVKR